LVKGEPIDGGFTENIVSEVLVSHVGVNIPMVFILASGLLFDMVSDFLNEDVEIPQGEPAGSADTDSNKGSDSDCQCNED